MPAPAIETFARCLSGEWRMCRLADRVGGSQLPAVITVDLRDREARTRGAISPRLAAGIRGALDAGGQVMLLLNRRGFATHVQCQACGHSMRCPQCEIALTLHQPGNKGICHGCGLVTRLPADCPECRSPGLVHRGTGTQRLEEQVRKAFPDGGDLVLYGLLREEYLKHPWSEHEGNGGTALDDGKFPFHGGTA